MTTGRADPDVKTKLVCREQMDFLYAWLNLGREPGLEFFREEAEQDMRLMMSLATAKELHPRTDDIVQMFRAIKEDEGRETGVRPLDIELRRRHGGGVEP